MAAKARLLQIEELEDSIKFLSNQQKLLEPYLIYLGNYLSNKVGHENLSIEKAFEIFKFITEYHTNATILIMKAKEVLINNERQ